LNHGMQPSSAGPRAVDSTLGTMFGRLYWRLDLESAMPARIPVDAVNFAFVIPGFRYGSTMLRLVVVFTLPRATIGVLYSDAFQRSQPIHGVTDERRAEVHGARVRAYSA
jgi:hypothetical protein